MKYFTFLVVLSAAVYHSQQDDMAAGFHEAVAQISEKCVAESGVDPELAKKTFNGEEVDGNEVKCLIKCVMVGLDFMDNDGNVHVEGLKDHFESGEMRDKIMEISEKCKDERGSDPCETAYAIHICAVKFMKSLE